ncbi:MAG: hypothetical protein OEV67_11750, partial [Betaproteobacteria bacterium]|nr:hypothetical protein [Betaproteobacteria bacterium]
MNMTAKLVRLAHNQVSQRASLSRGVVVTMCYPPPVRRRLFAQELRRSFFLECGDAFLVVMRQADDAR